MTVKVLIVRFSSIGDIVLTTPVVRNAKQQLNDGDVLVHYLTKKQFVPLLSANPYIDKIHTIDNKVSEVIDELKEEGFDYIFDLHKNLRSSQVKSGTGVLAFAFEKRNIEKWLLVNFKVNRMPDVHIVDRYMDTLSAFSIENDLKGLDYFIPKGEDAAPDFLPIEYKSGYLGFVIGGQHPGKMMPPSKIAEICDILHYPVVLLGGAEDAAKGEQIIQASEATIFNACGKLPLNASASLVRDADAIITHDTGLMHVAAAFKKNIVSIWGATVPEFGMSPYLPGKDSTIIEPKGSWDRPYSKLGDNKWYKPNFKGMEKIDAKEVADAAHKALKHKMNKQKKQA